MNLIEIRENAIDTLRVKLGMIDVIGWYPRRLFQGFTDAMVRIIPERSPRVFRVFDGGDVVEIDVENAEDTCYQMKA